MFGCIALMLIVASMGVNAVVMTPHKTYKYIMDPEMVVGSTKVGTEVEVIILYYDLRFVGNWTARDTTVTNSAMQVKCEDGAIVYKERSSIGHIAETIDYKSDTSDRSHAKPIYGDSTNQYITCVIPGLPNIEDSYGKISALGLDGYVLAYQIFLKDSTCTEHHNMVGEVYVLTGALIRTQILSWKNVTVQYPHVHAETSCTASVGYDLHYLGRVDPESQKTLYDTMTSRGYIPPYGKDYVRWDPLTISHASLSGVFFAVALLFGAFGPLGSPMSDGSKAV